MECVAPGGCGFTSSVKANYTESMHYAAMAGGLPTMATGDGFPLAGAVPRYALAQTTLGWLKLHGPAGWVDMEGDIEGAAALFLAAAKQGERIGNPLNDQ